MKIGVVGLGTMGAGIAQVCIEAGFETVGREVEAALGEKARGRIEHFVGRKVEKGQIDARARDEALGRLSLTTDLADLFFEAAYVFAARLGKEPIRCNDTPGFVVNRILIPLLNDCIRVLDEAGVSPEDLDKAMRFGAGWPMGPAALVDLGGIDIHVHASEALYEKLREPRMAPPPRLVRMAQAGKLGQKSGEGFYTHDRD